MTTSQTTLLQIENLTKRFPGVLANDRLCLDVQSGEIHALLGENGAGKSTLMNVIYGLLEPDEGRMVWKGKPYAPTSPRAAIADGIGMVHQHFMLVPTLTVLENIVLGLHTGFHADMVEAERAVLRLAEEFNQPIDPHRRVDSLSVGEQQRVEILKALYRGAELLILDEPTAVLTPQEAEQLFEVCRTLTARGKAVIFITHKLHEIMALSHRVTILRNGHSVATVRTADSSPQELARLMVGHDVSLHVPKKPFNPGATVLDIDNLHVAGTHGPAVRGMSFAIREGEIVGIAGVDGNGQTELVEAVLGLRPVETGRVRLGDEDVTGAPLSQLMNRGVAHVPGDRHAAAIVGDFSLEENALLSFSDREPFTHNGFLQTGVIRSFVEEIIRGYKVKAVSPDVTMNTLSGGNQQRFVMGRAMSHDPRLFVVVQPTRGMDVSSSEFVRGKIVELRDAGKAVLLVSMDLDEILALSDRIEVVHAGHISGSVPPDTPRTEIGLLMAGHVSARQPARIQS